ncbi:MAG: hypothetical protein NTZ10_04905 [Candidatus Saganbacteria bacterium]|nr:hypothetical protein [Candidatus Saganbacteria bacterium]
MGKKTIAMCMAVFFLASMSYASPKTCENTGDKTCNPAKAKVMRMKKMAPKLGKTATTEAGKMSVKK